MPANKLSSLYQVSSSYGLRLPLKPYSACLIAALIAFGAACRPRSVEKPPGYLVVGIESNPLELDPRYATDANSSRIGNLIYNSLLRADVHSHWQPELAEHWQMIDAKTYVFDLRRDVRFHDGRPLTAADVKFTYESILDPSSRSPKRALLKPLREIEQTGVHQLRFHLDMVHAPFVEQFALGIVPAGASRADGSSRSLPPGSGPFSIESIETGEKITLRANPGAWQGKPALAGVIFKVVPDAMVRVLEFKKGAVDFMQNDLEPDMLPWIRKNTDAAVSAHPGTTYQYIGINLTHPVLKHKRVRQALALAIDRNRMIRHLLKETVSPANGLLAPINWAYDAAIPPWPYDPERAKRLLDEAGFPDPDGEGPLPRFRLSYKTTNIDLRRRIAEALKDQLLQVGIELEIRSYEWGTFFSDVRKGNFHLYSLAWVGVTDPDIFYHIFHSQSVPPNGDNRGRYANPELDRLLEKGRAAADMAERKRIYQQAQRIIADDLPYVPLWWWNNVVVKRPAVRGFVPYPNGDFISFKNAALD
ncbi:MAG TPA: ABC transporter substrate-binding protein [Verrucomicrobiae bacterium]|nr:ABC transporter substrate-binding protein [Verrucomicrobiae bacterium]